MAAFSNRNIEELRQLAHDFADQRDWHQFHSVRNLLLAVISEMGELAEVVRWAGDQDPCINDSNRQAWEDEIADVFILLVRLADRSGVDLPSAFERKLAKAGEKYPVEEFKGSNRKA